MNPIEKRIAEVLECMALTDGIITKDEAEQIVQQCHIKGLTIEDIVEGKTPKSIAERWMHRRMSVHTEQTETNQDGKHYSLLPFSKVVHDDLMSSASDCAQWSIEQSSRWTFPILLRAKADEIDAERLSKAVETVIKHHPIFSMHIEEDGTHWYDQSYRSPYIKTEVSSRDGYVYLSLTLNRILGDAASFVLFAQNIWRAYRGEKLPNDAYLHYLSEYDCQTQTAEYAEHAQWLVEQYDAPDYPLLPKQDSVEGLLPSMTPSPLIVQPDYTEQLDAFSHKEHVSVNAFYCLVAALAIMDYNGTNEAGLTWAYLGRESREQMSIFGSLHRDIPMKLTKRGATKSEDEQNSLFAQLRERMEQGILHSDYPFTLISPKDSQWHSAVNVLVQPSIAEAFEGCPANFELVPTNQPTQSYCMLDIDITLSPLTLAFNYSPRHYKPESIQRFAELIAKNAQQLLGIESTTL